MAEWQHENHAEEKAKLTEAKADNAEDDKDHNGGRDGADQVRST